MNSKVPIPYFDVADIVNLLLKEVKEILGDQLISMYLHGSLANHDFDEYSDIDILFLTEQIISEEIFATLHELHDKISTIDSLWAIQLEVSYIPRDDLRHFDPFNNAQSHLIQVRV